MTLFDEDKLEEKEAAHDRPALPGEEIDRTGVSWVSKYDEHLSDEELDRGRKKRQEFAKKFIDFPESWWPNMNTRDKERMHLDQVVQDDIASGQYDDTWSVRDNHENPALSQFPSKLAKQILMMWSWENDQLFDPFAGHLSRPILSNHFNRNYWGCDVSKQYFDKTRERIINRCEGGLLQDTIRHNEKEDVEVVLRGNDLRLQRRDSREVGDVPSKFADFIMTSPPYFDLENYGDEDEQLGNANEEFEDFMDDMEQVLEHCHRILKPYRYAAFVVNDFRKQCRYNGLFDYHNALIERARNAGFQLHDIAMYPTGKSASMFTEQLVTMEVTGKVHEYILVFRRWPDEWDGASRDWDWQYRGLHYDVYPSEKIIEYKGIDYFMRWLQARRDRNISIERWVQDDGEIKFEGHPKHTEAQEEFEGVNIIEKMESQEIDPV